MTPTTAAPLLGDGTPYVSGMPLWDWYGKPLHPKNLTQPLELCGEGWYLGSLPLAGLYPSRLTALVLAVKPQREEACRAAGADLVAARRKLTEKEEALRRIDAEIAAG